MIRLVLFDMDGTLADTLPLCVEAFGRATEQLTGRRPTETELELEMASGWEEVWGQQHFHLLLQLL